MMTSLLSKVLEKELNSNVLLSPLSLQLALAVALEGAAEETAAQLQAAMGFTAETSCANAHEEMAELAKSVCLRRCTPELSQPASLTHMCLVTCVQVVGPGQDNLALATALWVHHALPLEPSFVGRAAALEAHAQNVDFGQTDAARSIINDWVSEKTHNKIPHLLSQTYVRLIHMKRQCLSLPPVSMDTDCVSLRVCACVMNSAITALTRLVITTAVHFKAQWVYKFKTDKTVTQPFHLLGGAGSVDVQMMTNPLVNVHYGEFESHRMVSLAYKDSPVRMLVLLPHVNSAEGLVAARASLAGIKPQFDELSGKQVLLKLPRFKVETDVELSPVLKSMGVTQPFAETADFSKLSSVATDPSIRYRSRSLAVGAS
jgi:serpin B